MYPRSFCQIRLGGLAALMLLAVPLNPVLADEPVPGAEAPNAAPVLPKATLAMIGGYWFDGTRFVPETWYSIEGKFTRERPAQIDVTIDLRGRFALPPLAEAHNHNLQNQWSARQMADDYLRRGIFYNAQMAAHSESIAGFRDLLNAPGTPDTLFAEATFSASNGHPIALAVGNARASGYPLTPEDLIDKAFWAVDTVADVEEKWAAATAATPKLIKIILVDANDEASRADPANDGKTGVRPELVPELVRRAHAAGARVAAHVQTADDARIAVEAGVDILAHLPTSPSRYITLADLRIDDGTIALMAKQGTMVIPTFEVYRQIWQRKPDEWARIVPVVRENITRLRAAGVPVLTGSDLWGGSVIDEIKALVGAGFMTRAEALQASTETTARALFPDRAIGKIAEGAEASFIVVASDPTLDLSALDRIEMAVKQGELIAR